MAIDFHSEDNRNTYASREADSGWAAAIKAIVNPVNKRVADIGCGGGIYSVAWHRLGAEHVTGVDFSAQMLEAARNNAAGLEGLTFQAGEATATGLPDACVDIVFERALIHHLPTYDACFAEAFRVLRDNGQVLIQDRTPEDVTLAGSPEHIRGYFFERFPRLLEVELARRPRHDEVVRALTGAGFTHIRSMQLWETRKTYTHLEALQQDLAQRTGRSILHELNDAELADLIGFISTQVGDALPMEEQDRWTLWYATKA